MCPSETCLVGETPQRIPENRGAFPRLDHAQIDLLVVETLVLLPMGRPN